MGVTTFINTNYNFFGDPVMPVIVVIMLLYLDFLQHMLFRAADIRIRKLKWRGLWMTKQIEGTVDDDVAVKLAIGEGRQADLEQERLELQALNSERFRHRFLERNRPWILQHLVELLTPRSLEQPGHDGRPVVEYVRDVYAELMVCSAASLSSYLKPRHRHYRLHAIAATTTSHRATQRRPWARARGSLEIEMILVQMTKTRWKGRERRGRGRR